MWKRKKKVVAPPPLPVEEMARQIERIHAEAKQSGRWEHGEVGGVTVIAVATTELDELMSDFWFSFYHNRKLAGPCLHSSGEEHDVTLISRLQALRRLSRDRNDDFWAECIDDAIRRIEHLEAQLETHQAAAPTTV